MTEGQIVGEPETNNHDPQHNAALALYRNGDYRQAANMYAGLEGRLGRDFWFRHDEAVALTATCEEKNVQKAIDLLESCKRENPNQTWVLSSLAIAYGRAGRYTDSLKAYDDSLRADPSNGEASIIGTPEERRSNVMGVVENLHTRGREFLQTDPRQAMRLNEAALALAGENNAPWAVFDKGKALASVEAFPESIMVLQRAREFLPDSTWPDTELGKVYEKMGRVAEAREAYRAACRKSSENQEALEGLTRVGNVNELGLFSDWSEYAHRRSDTLTNNPRAELDERTEIEKYLASLPQEYRNELQKLDESMGRKMDPRCRLAIVIPAYHEGKIITRSLSQYLNQRDRAGNPVNSALFEFVILDNHPESAQKDNTEEEIRKFQSEHPEIRISYAHKVWKPGEAGVGNARRYGNDLALLRFLNKDTNGAKDFILVSNDADIYGVSNLYISEIMRRFDNNRRLDALTGEWTLPDQYLSNPNVRACQRLWYLLDRRLQKNFVPGDQRSAPNFPKLMGLNTALRASMMAAIGGYNKHAKLAEDLEIGWMIRAARGDERTQEFAEKPMRMTVDPRRYLAAMVQGVPLIRMYEGFHENPEIRQANNDEVFRRIPTAFDPLILEKNADAIWQARNGPYQWYKDFFFLFDKTMKSMGIDYKIEDRNDTDGQVRSHIKIMSTTRLEKLMGVNKPREHREEVGRENRAIPDKRPFWQRWFPGVRSRRTAF